MTMCYYIVVVVVVFLLDLEEVLELYLLGVTEFKMEPCPLDCHSLTLLSRALSLLNVEIEIGFLCFQTCHLNRMVP